MKAGDVVISASRKTYIPRFHNNWMVNRVREEFVDVRNPMLPSQVSRYNLSPGIVDGIQHAKCVDSRIFERIGGCKLSRLKARYEEPAKDKAQRKERCCIESIDIGWATPARTTASTATPRRTLPSWPATLKDSAIRLAVFYAGISINLSTGSKSIATPTIFAIGRSSSAAQVGNSASIF